MSLARLAPDLQKVVSRLTTTTAFEAIDRKTLEWVAAPVKWPEQRARFQKVMGEAFGAEPAPIARTLGHVLKLREDLRAKRTTMKRVAAARETSVEELREYLLLAKLAPVVRDQVLGMTTVTMNELVTEESPSSSPASATISSSGGCTRGCWRGSSGARGRRCGGRRWLGNRGIGLSGAGKAAGACGGPRLCGRVAIGRAARHPQPAPSSP